MNRSTKPPCIWLPLLTGFIVTAVTTPVLAQTPFSLLNLGANVASYDARMEGRGGWGLAETDTLVPGFKNLAGLAEVDNVVLLLNGYFERRRIETVTTEAAGSRKTARVLTPNARVAFPLKGKYATLSAGFLSRRATEYTSVKPNSWLLGDVVVIGEEQFERRGTQFEIPLAFSLRLLRGLSIAASLNLISGNIRQTVTDIFLQPTDINGRPLYRPVESINRYEFSGVSGSSYVLFSPFRWLHLGGVYTPSHHVTVEQTQFMDGVASQARTCRGASSSDIRTSPAQLPLRRASSRLRSAIRRESRASSPVSISDSLSRWLTIAVTSPSNSRSIRSPTIVRCTSSRETVGR